MTLSVTTIEDAFRNAVLSSGTNTRVIFYEPNAPRPQLPYTSIQYLFVGPEINDWYELEDDDLTHYYGYRPIVFTINCYGDNSDQEVANLKGRLLTQTVRAQFRNEVSGSITLIDDSQDVSALIDDEIEPRRTVDVTTLINMEDGSTSDDTSYFDKVDDIEWLNRPPEN